MATDRRPLPIYIDGATAERLWETQFLFDVLLAHSQRPLVPMQFGAGNRVGLGRAALVVHLAWRDYQDSAPEMIARLRDHGARIGLIHMGDEWGNQDDRLYDGLDFVFRTYYFPARFADWHARGLPVRWIPNGFANGFGPIPPASLPPVALRRHNVFFSGTVTYHDGVKDDRRIIAEQTEGLARSVLLFQGLNTKRQLPRFRYRLLLQASRIGLVPAGNHWETVRLYECLEAGTVPVIQRAPSFEAPGPLADLPAIRLDDWRDLRATLDHWLAPGQARELAALQARMIRWWQAFKHQHQTAITDSLAGLYRPLTPPPNGTVRSTAS